MGRSREREIRVFNGKHFFWGEIGGGAAANGAGGGVSRRGANAERRLIFR